jgi:hypothetical protein
MHVPPVAIAARLQPGWETNVQIYGRKGKCRYHHIYQCQMGGKGWGARKLRRRGAAEASQFVWRERVACRLLRQPQLWPCCIHVGSTLTACPITPELGHLACCLVGLTNQLLGVVNAKCTHPCRHLQQSVTQRALCLCMAPPRPLGAACKAYALDALLHGPVGLASGAAAGLGAANWQLALLDLLPPPLMHDHSTPSQHQLSCSFARG